MLQTFKGILLSALLVCVAGCSSDRHDTSSIELTYQLDTLFIPVPYNVSAMLIRPHLYEKGSNEYVAFYDFQNHALALFDLTTQNFFRKIDLLEHGPDFVEPITAFSYYGNDLFVAVGSNYLSIFNMEGEVTKRISMNSYKDLNDFDFDRFELSPNQYSGLKFNENNHSILLQIISLSDRSNDKKYGGNRIAEIFLDQDSVSAVEVRIPADFGQMDGNYVDLTSIGYEVMGSNLVYNFPLSADIFIRSDEGSVERYTLESQYIQSVAEPLKLSNDDMNAERVKYQYTALAYYPVFFDVHRDLFYRVAKSEVARYDMESDFYLTVADNELNKVLEIPFPPNYYIFPIPSRGGLLFSAFNKHDDKLELIRYQFDQ